MLNPKVSVIVPVYKVAAYVEKCASSLFEQTLDDLEIIFVDDCGPDNSIELIRKTLEKYPAREACTQILKRPCNGGLAAARKFGLAQAKGEYIIHCDSDDWVDVDLYEKLYNKAVETNADIVVCDEIHEYADGGHLKKEPDMPSDCKTVVKGWYANTIGMFCHNKLIKHSLYLDNNIEPWEGLDMWEDNALITRLFYCGGRLAQIHDSCYHYNRTNVNAMTSGYGIKQVNQMVSVAQNLTDFFSSKTDAKDYEKTVMAFQFLARINFVTDSFENLKKYNNTFVGSEKIMSELDPNAFSSKGRFRFKMVKYHLSWLFVLMFKVKKLLHI